MPKTAPFAEGGGESELTAGSNRRGLDSVENPSQPFRRICRARPPRAWPPHRAMQQLQMGCRAFPGARAASRGQD